MERRRHILFISMHCRPEPCDTRTSQLARAMVERGHQATFLTSFPNYPFGKIYPGYRQRLVQRERVDDVEVVRVPMIPDHSKSKLRRFLSYLSFGLSAAVLGAAFTRRPDLIWIHHPPLTTGIAGWLLARIKRVPFVYEIHDLWPESLTSTGMIREGKITWAIRKVCHFLHRRADAVVVTSQGIRQKLIDQGLEPAKVHFFPQWADEAIFRPTSPDASIACTYGFEGKFNIVYGGNIGVAQKLDVVLEAARRMRDLADLQFVLVGAGVDLDRLRNQTESEGLENVRFLGQFPPEEMPAFFALADGLLLQLKDDPLFDITIPSKLQTYLAMGRPILCGARGEASKVLERAGAGISYSSEDAASLESAVRRLYGMTASDREKLGRSGRWAYEAEFALPNLADRYDLLFRSVACGQPVASVWAVVQAEAAGSVVCNETGSRTF